MVKSRQVSYEYMKYISECIFNKDSVFFVTYDSGIYRIMDIEHNRFTLTSWGTMIAEMNNGQIYECSHNKIHEIYRDFSGYISQYDF